MSVTTTTQALLFDMDGVLISSTESAVRCWRRWAAMYDVPDAENYMFPHGVRAIEIVQLLRPDIDAAEGLRVIEDIEIEDVAGITVLPGVRALLESLPLDRWAVVTSCTGRLLQARLRAAGLPIPQNLVSADMVERGKPDPLPYLRGAELLGLDPKDCIVVEDAASGVEAGVAAGCRVLALLTSTPASELDGATWIIPSLDGVTAKASENGLELTIPA